jgi:dGTPase
MDWADDTAYSLHDILDGVKARFITVETVERWAAAQPGLDAREQHFLDKLLHLIREEMLEPVLNSKIGQFIRACRLVPRAHPLAAQTQRYAWTLQIREETEIEAAFYKRLAVDAIFRSPSIQQIEFKGGLILDRLFAALREHYIEDHPRQLDILPLNWSAPLRAEKSHDARARLACDFLAELTDGAAIRLYRRLFEPSFGSITDLT